MRSLRRGLLLASAAGLLLLSCSVNQNGLTDDGGGAPTGSGGMAGAGATAGHGGSTGSGGTGPIVTGTAGNASGGSTAGAIAGSGGHGGNVGPTAGAGGAASGGNGPGGSNGGSIGIAGSGGTGNSGSPGVGGAGGAGDASGSGGAGGAGDASGSGGAGGAGNAGGISGGGGAGNAAGTIGTAGSGFIGVAGTNGGRGGVSGRGGTFGTGTGGRGGNAGRGGTGGNPCAGYPTGTKAFVTPTDGRTHCYWPRSSSQTWSEAQQSCTLQNGYLVTILSAEENEFVVSVAQFSSSFDDTWIGATDGKMGGDKTGAGTYKWVTNEAWGYSNWEQGQPDGFCDPCSSGQTCTCDHRAVLSSDGTWNDRWQDNTRSSVCEATPN